MSPVKTLPLIFHFKVREIIAEKKSTGSPVAAVIIEPIQAEGGDYHASPYFFRNLQQICKEVLKLCNTSGVFEINWMTHWSEVIQPLLPFFYQVSTPEFWLLVSIKYICSVLYQHTWRFINRLYIAIIIILRHMCTLGNSNGKKRVSGRRWKKMLHLQKRQLIENRVLIVTSEIEVEYQIWYNGSVHF